MASRIAKKLFVSVYAGSQSFLFIFIFFILKAKSKRFGGLGKYAQALKLSTFCPICYRHCCSQLFISGQKTYFLRELLHWQSLLINLIPFRPKDSIYSAKNVQHTPQNRIHLVLGLIQVLLFYI